MLEAKNIHKYYDMRKIAVLRDVSFRVPCGKTFSLLGTSGSGKSTLMGILSGEISPTSGSVLIDGREYSEIAESERGMIGYMPVRMRLYPEMTVNEYLYHILSMKNIRRKLRTEYAAQALEQARLKEYGGKLIQSMTIYERMRLKLAQAICGETTYLLLDEPTALLKSAEAAEMHEIIRGILSGGKYATVISTQHLREAKELSDNILIINNGKIAVNTSVQEISKGQKMLKMRLGTDRRSAEEYIAQMRRLAETDVLTHGNEKELELIFKYPREQDLREVAWKKTAEFGLPILEMTQQDISLEEIYLQITGERA